MKRIGILSDTHSCWDNRFAQHFADCDEIWHAGDVGCMDVLERLRAIGPTVRAVSGNIDHGAVARCCPESMAFTLEGINVFLIHIGGYPGRYSPGIRQRIIDEKIQLFVDGHSHILKVGYDNDLHCLHINPGAAGHHGWQKTRNLIKLTLDKGTMRDLEVIEFGRGPITDAASESK